MSFQIGAFPHSKRCTTSTFYIAFLAALLFASDHLDAQTDRPPNVIYILADDLGYADLSCYGQTHFNTPNIDRLATSGMRFTQHYSGSTVCAPSRSSLMTGLHTGHTFIRGNKSVKPEGQYPIPAEIHTMAEAMQNAGYVTGAFGKWGLGPPSSEGDPINQGFDRFFGYNCQSLAHHYYPRHLWSDKDSIAMPENAGQAKGRYAPALIQQEALTFIDDHQEEPFFLFMPNVIPHAELIAPEYYMEKYRGKYLPENKYEGNDDGPKYRLGPYESQEESHAAFAAMINVLDDQVGEIIDKVEALGLTENTLIIFTSDNGPHLEGGADPDYFDSNGPLKGYKRDLYEGGIRVPMLASWPGKITPGSESDHVSAFWDVFPTMAELAGFSRPNRCDGISFLPSLLGAADQEEHQYLYWEFHEKGGRQAIRQGNWKGVRYNVFKEPDGPLELYDLENDIGEEHDLSKDHPEVVAELEKLLSAARTPSEVFRFGDQ